MSATKNFLIKIFLLSTVALSLGSLEAQVVVRKTAGSNPVIAYRGISGNDALSAAVLSDLKNCGWFDVGGQGNIEYTIAGSTVGNSVNLQVAGKGGFSITDKVDQNRVRTTSQRLVDKILQKLFDVPGICQTKIVFCMELKPGFRQIYTCDFYGQNVKRITKNNFHCV